VRGQLRARPSSSHDHVVVADVIVVGNVPFDAVGPVCGGLDRPPSARSVHPNPCWTAGSWTRTCTIGFRRATGAGGPYADDPAEPLKDKEGFVVVFKRMLQAMGVGGPSVDTQLANPNCRPGGQLEGVVHVIGGDHEVDIEYVAMGLATRVEVESGDQEHNSTQEFHRQAVTGAFRLPAGARHSVPFRFPVPWETPITDVYGRRLAGMTMGLHTELEIARSIDKTDLDPVAVHPLPAQERILDALARIGFRFNRADNERGRIRGVQQTLPFYQEIEFYPAPQYASGITQLELTFVATPQVLQVILEIDKRGGLLTEGHDAFGRFTVDYASVDRTDWAAHIDGWLRQSAQRRGLFF
jgi:sporulation-control protein